MLLFLACSCVYLALGGGLLSLLYYHLGPSGNTLLNLVVLLAWPFVLLLHLYLVISGDHP